MPIKGRSAKAKGEEWREIEGYEGIYEVSDKGRVKSLHRVIMRSNGVQATLRERIRKLVPDKKGYLYVMLHDGGKPKLVQVHRLVALAFVDGEFDNACVNHKDFDPSNNCASNLEWTTHKENVAHSVDAGRYRNPDGTHRLSRLSAQDVCEIRRRRIAGDTLFVLADDFGVSFQNISKILKGDKYKGVGNAN